MFKLQIDCKVNDAAWREISEILRRTAYVLEMRMSLEDGASGSSTGLADAACNWSYESSERASERAA